MATVKGELTKHFTVDEYCVHQDSPCKITADAIDHAEMLEEFRVWLGKPMTVNSWYRSPEYNKKVGGNSNSNHPRGTATDISAPGISDATIVKYGKKWKSICEKHGTVGEIGCYSWGFHLGSHINYSKTFYNWKTDSKGQHNKYYKI